jgi:streptogramin lyase
VGGAPSGLAAGEGSVWVTDTGDGTLQRIDPDSMSLQDDAVRVGTLPAAVAVGEGSVWVTVALGNELVRVEP